MNKHELTALAERVEQAGASEQRKLLTEAFFALYPSPTFEPDWNATGNPFSVWQDREIRFKRMLDTEAYESAALTLVPEGWSYQISANPKSAYATVVHKDHEDEFDERVYSSGGKTPALALAAAALRSQAQGEGK